MTTKQQLRKMMLEKRQGMLPQAHAQACQIITEKLRMMALPPQAILAGYKAMRGEVDISQALIAAHDKKYTLCLPSVAVPERIMQFRQWWPKMAMKKGAYGTWEPEGGELLTPTILWIPLLAFDRAGYRLGYGGGYYDATLAYLKKSRPDLQTVGIAFAFQEVETAPHASHDIRLDKIVTEREVIIPDFATSAGLIK